MNIGHIAIYVKDLEKTKEFYQTYFDAKSNDLYHNENTDFKSYFLSFNNNTKLEIMHLPELKQSELNHKRTGYIHLAFCVSSKTKVNKLTYQLMSDGYDIISQPRTTGDGYYESCIADIEGNLIAIINK